MKRIDSNLTKSPANTKGKIMARKGKESTEPETIPLESPAEPTDPPAVPNNPPEPSPPPPAPDTLTAVNGHSSPLEKARAAKKAMGGGVKTVFYVLVGVSRGDGIRDILGEGKSRRGAEKLRESMRAATQRNYASVEVWKCRK